MTEASLPARADLVAAADSEDRATEAKSARRLGLPFWLPAAWIAIVMVAALGAEWLRVQDPLEMDLLNQSGDPSAAHWFGTDDLGRDMFARAVYGARISLTVGFIAPLIALVIGCALGITAGYFRGRWESLVLMYVDISLAFPGIVLLLLLVTYLGNSLPNLTVALGILIVPAYTRVSRANTLTFTEREFVLAARSIGASHARILTREILPNVLLPVMAYSFVLVALIIVVEGVLSFLGLGVPHPAPSWGSMINDGRELLDESPHVSFIPMGVMFLTVLSFNMLGDVLRKFTDARESAL
ncbi:MAG: ABC transporter permease [Candidatus Methylomirabilales bacterium]